MRPCTLQSLVKILVLLSQQFKRVHNDLSLSCFLLSLRKIRISRRIRYSLRAGNSGCSYRLGYRSYRTDVGCRNACFFNLFYHCCTATCTGSSGARQDYAVNACSEQVFSHFLTKLGSISNGS